jgi:mRNA interferase RelE/StbE
MYRIRILEAASRELARLDPTVSRRIVRRIHWLAKNLDFVRLQALKGSLSGLYKLRDGDYRIIYEILRHEKTIIIHSVGHRRDIYRTKE